MLDDLAALFASGLALETAFISTIALLATATLTLRFTLAKAQRRRARITARVAYLSEQRKSVAPLTRIADHLRGAFDTLALSEGEVGRLIDELFDEINANIRALNEVSTAWNEMVRSGPRESGARREFARKAKSAGAKLSTRFWDRNSDFILHSGLPVELKNAFRRFFEATRKLKQLIERMPGSPSLEDLGPVSDSIDDMLEAGERLHAAIEALPNR